MTRAQRQRLFDLVLGSILLLLLGGVLYWQYGWHTLWLTPVTAAVMLGMVVGLVALLNRVQDWIDGGKS